MRMERWMVLRLVFLALALGAGWWALGQRAVTEQGAVVAGANGTAAASKSVAVIPWDPQRRNIEQLLFSRSDEAVLRGLVFLGSIAAERPHAHFAMDPEPAGRWRSIEAAELRNSGTALMGQPVVLYGRVTRFAQEGSGPTSEVTCLQQLEVECADGSVLVRFSGLDEALLPLGTRVRIEAIAAGVTVRGTQVALLAGVTAAISEPVRVQRGDVTALRQKARVCAELAPERAVLGDPGFSNALGHALWVGRQPTAHQADAAWPSEVHEGVVIFDEAAPLLHGQDPQSQVRGVRHLVMDVDGARVSVVIADALVGTESWAGRNIRVRALPWREHVWPQAGVGSDAHTSMVPLLIALSAPELAEGAAWATAAVRSAIGVVSVLTILVLAWSWWRDRRSQRCHNAGA